MPTDAIKQAHTQCQQATAGTTFEARSLCVCGKYDAWFKAHPLAPSAEENAAQVYCHRNVKISKEVDAGRLTPEQATIITKKPGGYQCYGYGFKPETADFSRCLMQMATNQSARENAAMQAEATRMLAMPSPTTCTTIGATTTCN